MTMARMAFLVVVACALLSACGGGAASTPSVTSLDPYTAGTLQFAVGTATVVRPAAPGALPVVLNVVETFRQSNGLSASLYNEPVITMPPSAVNNMCFNTNNNPPVDQGTNRITEATFQYGVNCTSGGTGASSGECNVAAGGAPAPCPTQLTGAFGYGLCGCDSNVAPASGFATLYQPPTVGIAAAGGPPLFPSQTQYQLQCVAYNATSNACSAQQFVGYPFGFTAFVGAAAGQGIVPVAGQYRLDLAFPPNFTTSGSNGAGSAFATAQLTNTTGLPRMPTPSFSPDGSGGGTIGVGAIPAGVTEAFAIVNAPAGGAFEPLRNLPSPSPAAAVCYTAHANNTSGLFPQVFAIRISSGQTSVVLPDDLGFPDANGNATASICPGESLSITIVGFDYPAFEAAYPFDLQQTPTITNASGQADVTINATFATPYPE